MKLIYETERLIIRFWEEKDANDLYEYAKDEEVTKFLTFKPYASIVDAKDRISYILETYETNEIVRGYAIEFKEEAKVIGSIDIVHYSPKAEGTIEIGYLLGKNYQGKGYLNRTPGKDRR